MCSHLLTTYMCTHHLECGLGPWQTGVFVQCLCGTTSTRGTSGSGDVGRDSLLGCKEACYFYLKVEYLMLIRFLLQRVVSASSFGDALKQSPVSDLTLSRSAQDFFCFHCRSERITENQRSLFHPKNHSLCFSKCFLKHFRSSQSELRSPSAWSLPLHSPPIQLRQISQPQSLPSSLPLSLAGVGLII